MTAQQRTDLLAVAGSGLKGAGVLDYVAAWYLKGAQVAQQHPGVRVAFVSTNSITQGEQVGLLWGDVLHRYGCHIQFAHRTFRWSNEARGNAAVYCVIIGYGVDKLAAPKLFDYETPRSAPQLVAAKSINPYLVDGPEVIIGKRSNPLSAGVPGINFGNMPLDGGHLLLSETERQELLAVEPEAVPFLKRFVGAQEFLYKELRWCLWLENIAPSQLKGLPLVLERVQKVKAFREASVAPSTQKFAATPTLFRDRKLPANYLLIPGVTSENRRYIPIGYLTDEVVPSNLVYIIPDATPYLFGILTSEMHMAWVRQVCGRLESRFRYSGGIVYNNYPFPPAPTDAQRQAVTAAAEAVLAARAQFPGESLAALYNPATMPPALARAHQALDRAVDKCYRPAPFASELARLEFLFGLYQQLSAPVLGAVPNKKRR